MFSGLSGNSFQFEITSCAHNNRHIIPHVQVIGKSKQAIFHLDLAHLAIYP